MDLVILDRSMPKIVILSVKSSKSAAIYNFVKKVIVKKFH